MIQVRPKNRTEDWHEEWQDCVPEWLDGYEYRIKPEPTFQLPPAPPGMRWHREDGWQEGDLPQGWRPLVDGERGPPTGEIKRRGKWETLDAPNDIPGLPARIRTCHCRTRRPLAFEHAGKTWTWHRPGDPMPCDGDARIHYLTKEVEHSGVYSVAFAQRADSRNWDSTSSIIGWRYADEKKTVPLGPEDVPPGSVFRYSDSDDKAAWQEPHEIDYEGAAFHNGGGSVMWKKWDYLAKDFQINRSIPLTGKWDASAWEPCSKQI
jgi:hypothetical protein